MLYPAAKLTTTDLGYAVTGHTGQGGTVARGEAVFRGDRRIEASLGEAMEDRRAWEQVTAGPRRLAVAADSEPAGDTPRPRDVARQRK